MSLFFKIYSDFLGYTRQYAVVNRVDFEVRNTLV